MTATLTYEEVTEALNKRVERLGADYVYQPVDSACVYSTPDKQPSCAVGDVFFQLAPVVFDKLYDLEWPTDNPEFGPATGKPAWGGSVASVFQRRAADDLIVSPALQYALRRLQSAQDSGWPLGRAVKDFHEAYTIFVARPAISVQ